MPKSNPVLGGGGFHHVAIKVADFDRSVKLYTEALGFKEKIRWGEKTAEQDSRAVMLDTGDGNYLEIFAGGPKPPLPAANAGASAGQIIHFAIRTTDVDAATKRAEAAGFVVTVPPKSVAIPSTPHVTPVRLSFVQGPDGETIEFFQNELI